MASRSSTRLIPAATHTLFAHRVCSFLFMITGRGWRKARSVKVLPGFRVPPGQGLVAQSQQSTAAEAVVARTSFAATDAEPSGAPILSGVLALPESAAVPGTLAVAAMPGTAGAPGAVGLSVAAGAPGAVGAAGAPGAAGALGAAPALEAMGAPGMLAMGKTVSIMAAAGAAGLGGSAAGAGAAAGLAVPGVQVDTASPMAMTATGAVGATGSALDNDGDSEDELGAEVGADVWERKLIQQLASKMGGGPGERAPMEKVSVEELERHAEQEAVALAVRQAAGGDDDDDDDDDGGLEKVWVGLVEARISRLEDHHFNERAITNQQACGHTP